MSLLEQQLKDLQTKKEKVSYFHETIGALELLTKPDEANEPAVVAREQVISQLVEYVKSQIEAIESGKEAAPQKVGSVGGQFSESEVEVLKAMVARMQSRPAPVAPQQQSNQPSAFSGDDDGPVNITKSKPQAPAKKGQDVLQFAMAHRHLDGKRVVVRTRDGEVGGVVRGMMVPNIIVQTDTGHEAHVPPESLTLE